MISEYVLLCAPYRFSKSYLDAPLSKMDVEKDLFSAIMPGVNLVTRKLVLLGIKNNFGIVDKDSLIEQVYALESGDYQIMPNINDFIAEISNEKQKDILSRLNTLTKGRGIQGFDDCRIIDIITKSYAGKLIDDNEFNNIFNKHSLRIKNSYDSWEQYLSSCVLGKIMQLCDESFTIISKEEFISDIYYYCITPTNIFSYSKFWNDYNLDNLRIILQELLEIDSLEAKNSDFSQETYVEDPNFDSSKSPSSSLLNAMESSYIDTKLIDLDKYAYLSDLANYVFWNPIVENGLEWMFSESNESESYFLMPKEYLGLTSAKEFWTKYEKFSDLKNNNIFAIFDGLMGVKAVFTEKEVYTFKKKLFGKPTLNNISWKDVNLSCKLDIISGVSILLDNKTILEILYPNFEMIGLTKSDIKAFSDKEEKEFTKLWTDKANKLLKEIPQKIEEFKNIKN